MVCEEDCEARRQILNSTLFEVNGFNVLCRHVFSKNLFCFKLFHIHGYVIYY